MRQSSNFENFHGSSAENEEKEQEFGSFFPFAPPRIRRQGSSVRHTETRLFCNRKDQGVVDETKSTTSMGGNVYSPFVSNFSLLKKKRLIQQNGSNVDDIRNPNNSDHAKDSGFHFVANNGDTPDHSDKAKAFTRTSLVEGNRSTLHPSDEINYFDTADSGGLGIRNKSAFFQRERGRSCFMSSFSVLGVGAGLSSLQRGRFQKSMEASSLSHNQVKLKLLELLKYWMGFPSVRFQIHSIVQDTLDQAGINSSPVREVWCEASRPGYYKCKGNSNMRESHTNDGNFATNSSTYIVSHEPVPNTHVPISNHLGAQEVSDANIAISPAHSFHPLSTPSPPTSVRTSKASPRAITSDVENASQQETECLLSPSPQILETTFMGAHTASTLPYSAPSIHRFPLDAGEPKRNELPAPQNPVADVPRTPDKEAVKAKTGRGTRCNSWASFSKGVDDDVATTRGVKGSNEGPSGASYEDIPQFYFPLGRPTTQESVISRPLSTKIQNPHLKMLESVPFAGAMYDTTDIIYDSLVSYPNKDKASMQHDSTMPSMSTLRCMEDKCVSEYLHKEFHRLLHSRKSSTKTHSLEGQLNGLRRIQHTKREANYKHCLIECIERICVNCFGIPRYFAYIVLYLILNEVAINSSDTTNPRTSGRFRLSSMHGSVLSSYVKQITVQHLLEFYNECLKGKDSIRRTFDLLILSSSLKSDGAAVDNQKSRHQGLFSQRTTALRSFLLPGDFEEYINVILHHHPGLSFLKKTPEFCPRYINTVIYRILYDVDRYDRGRISFAAFSSSRLMDAFRQVDATPDINSVLLFFSYEHFYVLYCRFWELDEDCDMLISQKDFSRYYPDGTFNPLIIQRIFSGVGRRIRCEVEGYIGYEDFVWFCLSEEDKSTPQAIQYWFRILDLDGDGILSIYEMRTFYNMVEEGVSFVGENVVPFENIVRQVFDMIRCSGYRGLTLADLLHDPQAAHVLLNMLTDFVKLLQYERSDPLVAYQERLIGGLEQSHWDRFVRAEYDRMAQETDT